MELGSAIKKIRKEKGIQQKKFALLCGISITAIVQIEGNQSFPHKETMNKICNALNITPSFLLFSSLTEEDVPIERRPVFHVLKNALSELLSK